MQFLQQDRISTPEPSTIHRRVLQHTVFSHNLGSHPNEDVYFPQLQNFRLAWFCIWWHFNLVWVQYHGFTIQRWGKRTTWGPINCSKHLSDLSSLVPEHRSKHLHRIQLVSQPHRDLHLPLPSAGCLENMLLDTIPTTQGLGFGAYYLFAGMAVIASVWFTLVLPESKVRYNVVESLINPF